MSGIAGGRAGHAVGSQLPFCLLRQPTCLPVVCRMPSDAALDPMRRLSRMMERTMKAEFSFPPDKPLRWGRQLVWAWPTATGRSPFQPTCCLPAVNLACLQ